MTEDDLYRRMAEDYRKACAAHPFTDHALIAMKVGARILEIPVKRLQAKSRKKNVVETRLRLMAFTRVVSLNEPRPNSLKRVGRAFQRHHATVVNAIGKYGDEIARAIR